MAVRTFHPRVSVVLHKTIGRQIERGMALSRRFVGNARSIDLTPFLGEGGGVRTSKSVRDPAGGFNITLADRMFGAGQDGLAQMESLYGLIEPMDLIEIRMAHDPSQFVGGELPIVMRGFVSEVNRVEAVGPDGRPTRSVVVSGQDYGKILQIMRIFYLPNYVLGQSLLTNFRLFLNYGVGFSPNQPPGQFVAEVIDKIVNPYLDQLASRSGTDDSGRPIAPVSRISVRSSVPDGSVSPFGLNQYQGGTIDELLRYFGDVGPFNELFIEDREEANGGVVLVYRPNPYRGIDGGWIRKPADGAEPAVVEVDDRDLQGMSASRSDADVANYFWVDAPRYELNNPEILRLEAATGDPASFLLTDHPNSTPYLYGLRQMQTQTQQGGTEERTRQDNQPQRVSQQERDVGRRWLSERRRQLIAQNADNVVLERGNMQLRGNEAIRAGSYVRLRRGTTEADYYAVAVDHDYRPFQAYRTTVRFERGMGFVGRIAREQAPYLAEIDAGGAGG